MPVSSVLTKRGCGFLRIAQLISQTHTASIIVIGRHTSEMRSRHVGQLLITIAIL
jgi:hypothetical protein